MKYIIELEKISGTDLWKAKGAETLVFNEYGIKNILKPYEDECEFEPITYDKMLVGDTIRAKNGKTLYEFCGLSNNTERINAINIEKGQYVCLPSNSSYVRKVREVISPWE